MSKRIPTVNPRYTDPEYPPLTLKTANLPENLEHMPPPESIAAHAWPPELAPAAALDNTFSVIRDTGAEETLKQALEVHPDNAGPNHDRRWLDLAAAMSDPANANVPFSQLCHRYRINWRELASYFIDYQRTMALFIASAKTPVIVYQLAEDATKHEVPCPDCKGKGKVWEEEIDEETGRVVMLSKSQAKLVKVTCLSCEGSGKVMKAADKEDRKTMMELSGLIQGGKAGPAVNINIGSAGSVEDTVTDVGKLLNVTPEA